jgi:hypothetical protein
MANKALAVSGINRWILDWIAFVFWWNNNWVMRKREKDSTS